MTNVVPRDLIDTEPAEGDAYKMILGSLSSEMDEIVTIVTTLQTEGDESPKSPDDDIPRPSLSREPSRASSDVARPTSPAFRHNSSM